jgi:hypothetical protein
MWCCKLNLCYTTLKWTKRITSLHYFILCLKISTRTTLISGHLLISKNVQPQESKFCTIYAFSRKENISYKILQQVTEVMHNINRYFKNKIMIKLTFRMAGFNSSLHSLVVSLITTVPNYWPPKC